MNSHKTPRRRAFDAWLASLSLEQQRAVLAQLNVLTASLEAERTEQDRIDATARELLADIDL